MTCTRVVYMMTVMYERMYVIMTRRQVTCMYELVFMMWVICTTHVHVYYA